jgi:hypothetical protein
MDRLIPGNTLERPLKFAAHPTSGASLGMLVIADRNPRPTLAAADTRAVVQLRTTGASLEGETQKPSWTITPIVSTTGELIALVATVLETSDRR